LNHMKSAKRVSRRIPLDVRCMLWGRAAGRCEFAGCNQAVSWHHETKETVNIAEAAHIIGFSEDGPRGEKELSEELARDISNLMLLCRNCHKPIDANRDQYPVELLRKMKYAHEQRIELVTSIAPERKSVIVLYGANVGEHSSPLTYEKAARAMFPDWYPAERTPIQLGLVNSSFLDHSPEFWRTEAQQLRSMVAQRVRPRLANGDIAHLSLFGFAPQPLLMLFGFLLSDIPTAETYQLHREPPDWKWQAGPDGFEFIVERPAGNGGDAALVLALSATIIDRRVHEVLGEKIAIWRISAPEPHNDFLKSRSQLSAFREAARRTLDQIKANHGERATIYVFPAVPVSVAVDFGRIVMPKADLPLRIYDENKSNGGFAHALDLDAANRLAGVPT
jgi:hypothetical protein